MTVRTIIDFSQKLSQLGPCRYKAETTPAGVSLIPFPARRRNCTRGFLLLLLSALLCSAPGQVLRHEAFALRNSTQLLVVTTPEWNSVAGVLYRYERSAPGATWKVVGYPIAVVVGKNGLGWDAGAEAADPHGARKLNDPVKKEGDLRSPAGIFHLGTTFGYASQKPAGWAMPYLHLTSSTDCVDDPNSRFYNEILNRAAVIPDWSSSEAMRRSDDLYRLGLVIKQNDDPAQPGDGSCIFLHIWPGPGQATVGCTATAQRQVEIVLGWLDPRQDPALVQLPASKYSALEEVWGLPPIP